MLTIKQGQLLSQLEAFDQECENMRDQLEAARDSTSNTSCELSDVVKQKEQLYNENTRLLVSDYICIILQYIIGFVSGYRGG